MLSASASVSAMPSIVAACAFTSAQVAMPSSAPVMRLPVACGSPAASSAYSRRKTWCDGWEV